MSTTFILVHSPLVGPGTWLAVARRLASRGHVAHIPSIRLDDIDAPYDVAIAGGISAQVGEGPPAILALHSGAGALAPAIARRVPLTGVIFLDAVLPTPGRSWFDTAPRSLGEHLRDLARDGTLPPWPAWFGEEIMSRLLPYAPLREAFTEECPPLPLAYFEEPASAEPMPVDLPAAYLQLSEGYAEEADRARALSWLIRAEPLHHLALLTHPDRLATHLDEMAKELAAL